MTDNGLGISEEDQVKIFSQFFRSDDEKVRAETGWGLGLNVTKNLVELMGGLIWLESLPGLGSTFHFTVPLHEAQITPGTALWRNRPPLADLNVLVVDDNATCRDLICTMVGRWGSQAHGASSVEEACALLQSTAGMDLILVDSTLEGIAPAEAAARVLSASVRKRPHLILVAPVGTRSDSDYFVAQVSKPLKPAQVRDTILRVVSGAQGRRTKAAAAS